jgi:hypothetical protein
MDFSGEQIKNHLLAKYKGARELPWPRWLKDSRWVPTFVMSLPADPRVIAVEVIPSANIPRTIYRREVKTLQQQHKELRVVVCVSAEGLEEFPDASEFCHELSFGLKSFIPSFGLQTIVTTDLDTKGGKRRTGTRVSAPKAARTGVKKKEGQKGDIEIGWFPRQILDRATGLTRLAFRQTLDLFCRRIVLCGDDEVAAVALVKCSIDELLQYYPKCHANAGSFMKLAHFESLFRKVDTDATEHVLHSFRVFLVGCVIINTFYDQLLETHKRFSLGKERKVSIEYCWLLASIFHDVGYPWQRSGRLVEMELDDEDAEVYVVSKGSRWIKKHYTHACRMLSSLGAFVATSPAHQKEWDGGMIPDGHAEKLGIELMNLHDQRNPSHAIVSAFRMLSSIVEQAQADDKRTDRFVVVTHAVPAALAILLHDWRLWKHARKWRLFPVDMCVIPLAAILIFIDTWDDFKRKTPPAPVSVDEFKIDGDGVGVSIRWHRTEDYEKENEKYRAFGKAIKNQLFRMRIVASVEGAR